MGDRPDDEPDQRKRKKLQRAHLRKKHFDEKKKLQKRRVKRALKQVTQPEYEPSDIDLSDTGKESGTLTSSYDVASSSQVQPEQPTSTSLKKLDDLEHDSDASEKSTLSSIAE